MKAFLACALTLVLSGCLPAMSAQVQRQSPPLTPVGTYPLRGDPDFSPTRLSSEMRLWHSRLWEGIETVNSAGDGVRNFGVRNPEDLAASGDLYNLGRHLNVYVTSLLTALRVTGDLALLDEADRLMEIARAELADTNADGYLNWRYLNRGADASSRKYYGDDYHVMDEILTHSLVAAVAYALHQNAPFNPRYAEHAEFWTDYLKNDFEAKWRERNDVPFDFPFLSRDLTHPYVQWIRYHYYMFGLTGEAGYYGEAERMAQQVGRFVKEVYTPGGPALVWNHRFTVESDSAALSCQPFVYLQYTFQAFQDLALEGFNTFADDAFMQKVATAMTELVMDNGTESFSTDICGGTFQRGMFPSRGERGYKVQFLNFPFGVVGKWDATGKVEEAVQELFEAGDFNPASPVKANLSATMLLLLADGGEQAAAGE